MKRKRALVITVSVAAVLLLALGAAYIAGGIGAPKPANAYRSLVNDGGELIARIYGQLTQKNEFDPYRTIADIPETDKGYVPQGYCFSEALNAHIISYYHSERASVISLIDGDSGERIKTLNLTEGDGGSFTGHAGGIADSTKYLYFSDGTNARAISLDRIASAKDYTDISADGIITLDPATKCSYLNADGEYLYAGEFYTFEFGDKYDTDKSHRIMMNMTEQSYARCNAYKLSQVDACVQKGAQPAAQFSLAVPNRVQGIARLTDGAFALSVSYGRKNNSALMLYGDVTEGECDYKQLVGGTEVPVYFMTESDINAEYTLPPMLEGIDVKNGKITGIFESGAKRYSDAKFIENSICEF